MTTNIKTVLFGVNTNPAILKENWLPSGGSYPTNVNEGTIYIADDSGTVLGTPFSAGEAIIRSEGTWKKLGAVFDAGDTVNFKGSWDASSGNYPVGGSAGDIYEVTVGGTVSGTVYLAGDAIIKTSTGWIHGSRPRTSSEITNASTVTGATVTNALEGLQTQVTTSAGDITTLQTNVGTLQTDVGTLQTDVGTLQTDMSTAQADITALENGQKILDVYVNAVSGDNIRTFTSFYAAYTALNNTIGSTSLTGTIWIDGDITYMVPNYLGAGDVLNVGGRIAIRGANRNGTDKLTFTSASPSYQHLTFSGLPYLEDIELVHNLSRNSGFAQYKRIFVGSGTWIMGNNVKFSVGSGYNSPASPSIYPYTQSFVHATGPLTIQAGHNFVIEHNNTNSTGLIPFCSTDNFSYITIKAEDFRVGASTNPIFSSTLAALNNNLSLATDTTIRTSSFTASLDTTYFVDTTSGSVTMTLPRLYMNGLYGSRIRVIDYNNTFATNNFIVANSGWEMIEGAGSNVTFNESGAIVDLVYSQWPREWKIHNLIQVTPPPPTYDSNDITNVSNLPGAAVTNALHNAADLGFYRDPVVKTSAFQSYSQAKYSVNTTSGTITTFVNDSGWYSTSMPVGSTIIFEDVAGMFDTNPLVINTTSNGNYNVDGGASVTISIPNSTVLLTFMGTEWKTTVIPRRVTSTTATNLSNVAGTTVTAALNALDTDVGILTDNTLIVDPIVKTSDFNAVAQTIYFVDYNFAASPTDLGIIATLPGGIPGTRIVFYDYSNNFGLYPLKVRVLWPEKLNGSTASYPSTDVEALANGAWVECFYIDATEGWKVTVHNPPTTVNSFYWKDNSTFNGPAALGYTHFIDTSWPSSGTVHLPANPIAGQWFEIIDPTDFYGTGNVTVYHNNQNIQGVMNNVVLNRNGLRAKFIYTGIPAIGWVYTLSKNVINLGADTTGDYVQNVTVSGSGISIDETSGEGSTPTITLASASTNTASTVVYRDGSGNFAANDVTVNSLIASNGIVLDKTAGEGIRVDTTTPTYPWFDLLGNITSEGGANSPDLVTYRNGIKQYRFTAINDEVFLEFHITHDYVPGTDLYIHAHWSHISAAVTTGAVTWNFEHTYSKGHGQGAGSIFGATKTVTVTQTASTNQYEHMIAEVQLSTPGGSASMIDSNALEPDGIIFVRLYLSTNTMSATTDPFCHFADIHYQSTGIGTKQKAPNFYS